VTVTTLESPVEAIQPAYSTAVLLLIAAAAVALLLFLIIAVKLHAFVSLVLVSLVTAVVAGIPVADVPTALLAGFGSTLGSVALLVGFGVMLGRLLEVTGGAQVLADTLVSRFGEHRAPFALGVAALIFGFPIFFDAGLVVFLPIILTVARRFGGSVLYYALPAAGAFAAMHAIVPPHPGPVAAGTVLNGDIGVVLLVGLPIALISWYVGVYLVSRFLGARVHVDIPDLLFGEVNGGHSTVPGPGPSDRPAAGGEPTGGDRTHAGAATATATASTPATTPPGAPTFGTVLGLLLIPLVLISLNTVLTTLVSAGALAEDQTWIESLQLLGNTPVALLVTLLVAIAVLGRRQGSLADTTTILDQALGPICSIILITGAGGMFGGVLRASGIGEALTSSLSDLGLPLLLHAFLIATALRVAQGSATVALTTASGLIASQAAGLDNLHVALLVVAIAAGATVLSHVNDSGFWLVSRFFAMDEKTTLKTWTVMETTLGLTAFVVAAILWPIASL
jgi:GntP family gluconate:H+ symporter